MGMIFNRKQNQNSTYSSREKFERGFTTENTDFLSKKQKSLYKKEMIFNPRQNYKERSSRRWESTLIGSKSKIQHTQVEKSSKENILLKIQIL